MNTLQQIKSGLLSSEEDIKKLSQMESAKFLVISDSHGAPFLMQELIESFAKSCDGIIFCGDGIGDLFHCIQLSEENKSFAKKLPPVIAYVQGNNDTCSISLETGGESKRFTVPPELVFNACGKEIFVTHGHLYSVYYNLELLENETISRKARIVLYGHTHVPFEQQRNVYIMNPGSIRLPRSQSSAGFAILEVTKRWTNTIFYKVAYGANGMETTPYFPAPVFM